MSPQCLRRRLLPTCTALHGVCVVVLGPQVGLGKLRLEQSLNLSVVDTGFESR